MKANSNIEEMKANLKTLMEKAKMGKVVAITGDHKSVQSLLAEFMGDDMIKAVVIMGFDDAGGSTFAHFNATRKDAAFAACVFAAHAVEDDE